MFLVEYKGMNWVKIPIGAHTFEENAKATKSQKIVKKAALEKKVSSRNKHLEKILSKHYGVQLEAKLL